MFQQKVFAWEVCKNVRYEMFEMRVIIVVIGQRHIQRTPKIQIFTWKVAMTYSGMALAGFDETRYTIKPPSCEIFLQTMAAEERQKCQNFLSHIMSGPFDISSNHSHLQPLGYHMFAAFMRWYPVFIGDFGHNHCALDKLKSAMLIFEYNWDMFDVWSDLVQKDFLAKNARIFATEDTFRDEKESLYGPQILEGVLQIKTTQIIESKKCEDQRKRLDKIERIVSDIHQLGR